MTKRLPSGPPCFDPAHGHVVIARRRPLPVDEAGERRFRLRRNDGTDLYVTAWLCPVRHEVSVIVEDESDVDVGRAHGGPLDEL